MDQLNLEAIDVDGAVREAAEEVAGDTRLSFLRKGALAGGAALSGGAILSGLMPSLAGAAGSTRPPAKFGPGDVGILNFALTLEYLESAFYNEATAKRKIHDRRTANFLKVVTKDERAHVAFLHSGIKAAGAKPVAKPKFNFQGIPGNQAKFQQTAFVLENTGVHAYLGQAGNIKDKAYLGAAGSILTIEARHAAVIATIIHKSITPDGPFDTPLTANEVLAAVKGTGFIVG